MLVGDAQTAAVPKLGKDKHAPQWREGRWRRLRVLAVWRKGSVLVHVEGDMI